MSRPEPARPCPPEQLRARLEFPDDRLLAECEVQHYRSSGPGGQHRNKVSTAIRLTHRLSGLSASGSESRSQMENRVHAIKRLRETIALTTRLPLAIPVVWPATVHVQDGRLRVNESNDAFPIAMAIVLDAFAAASGELRPAAGFLSLTPSSLARFVRDHPKAWREVARLRQAAGLPPLRAD